MDPLVQQLMNRPPAPSQANSLWAKPPTPPTGAPGAQPTPPLIANLPPSIPPPQLPPGPPQVGGSLIPPPNPHPHLPSETQRYQNAGAMSNMWAQGSNPTLTQTLLDRKT